MAWYNDNDRHAAAWLRELVKAGLIAEGEVDERSITELRADELMGGQRHFFAGIGGWSYALRLAGWPDDRPVWTGSCPCQPFSSAGKQQGTADPRHLWPAWFRLIRECRPPVIFGEQVASAIGHGWMDELCDDMEGIGYSVGAAILPACCLGFDHVRSRVYFVCHANSYSQPGLPINAALAMLPGSRGDALEMEGEDGIPSRMDIMRGYGNAIVPQVAAEVIRAYMETA